MKGCGTFSDRVLTLPRKRIDPRFDKLGNTIRAVRQELDISMGELARFLRCSVARLSDLETGTETDERYQFCGCESGCADCAQSGIRRKA